MKWNASPHPISDIRDWSSSGRLELRPDFQRRSVWSNDAQIMLMDTILKEVPMPKIFLATQIRDDQTYRIVIDGQQRITAILDFLKDKFRLSAPFQGPEQGKVFSELDDETRARILSYSIDFNEANDPTDEETREVYSRVNKYTIALNKQELRRADFPGQFLDMSEEISTWDFFENLKIFSTANRRRYNDVEYISEILAALIGGVQDKKDELDIFYRNYAEWDIKDRRQYISRLQKNLGAMSKLFSIGLEMSKTRFRQKADFYSLLMAVDELHQEGYSLDIDEPWELRRDFDGLDMHISPESDVEICSEYAIKCVSQANSASSRRWRVKFLKAILAGSFTKKPPNDHYAELYYRYLEEACIEKSGMCIEPEFECPVCQKNLVGDFKEGTLFWNKSAEVFQMNNASWMHTDCVDKSDDLIIVKRPDNDPNFL
ncbi:MAG: hypothetical protein ACI9KA_002142 [Parasphingorhabdus sp.]|jgi:hypothetical protein|uniref:DUF262 domain-containing protein n=1 Tax=Parasphingorhabdus sp. TaxID=2709688 RepID=UPI0039E45F8E